MTIATFFNSGRRLFAKCLVALIVGLSCLLLFGTPPALAGVNDDTFEGNIFILYAGNAKLMSTKLTLEQSLAQHRPTLLVFYADDSSDCKQYATVMSRVDAFYGRAAELIPVNVDSIPTKSRYSPTEPGYYYKGLIPQLVVFDQSGKVVLNEKGQVPYERLDDVFRKVFNLVPRSESVELKRRVVNEFNTELTE